MIGKGEKHQLYGDMAISRLQGTVRIKLQLHTNQIELNDLNIMLWLDVKICLKSAHILP